MIDRVSGDENMPRITLPDGSVKSFDGPVTAYEVAASIGSRLAQAALGCKINGELADLHQRIEDDAELSIITDRDREGVLDADALYLLRHSAAHVMAEAIQQIKPGAQLVYGPPVDNGFYYDIAFTDGVPLSSDEFAEVEKIMAAIIKEDRPFTRYDLSLDEGMDKLKGEGSKYKIDNAENAIKAGADSLSFYATGEPGTNWEDLCRGPHVPSTGRIGAFKLMSVASSYWHGDANSDSLTRVYGTAFPKKKDLNRYLEILEEAKKRDHRVVGKKLGLFSINEDVGQGLVLWHPRGAQIRRELEEFLRKVRTEQGFKWVNTPHVGKLDLYRTSGHFPYYKESQYPPLVDSEELHRCLAEHASPGCGCAEIANAVTADDVDGFLLKPMNCPHHVKIYDADPHSYRDLPLRLAEFGTVYRWEQSGECHGLTRVRGFTQDDSHIFCTPDQVAEEVMIDLKMAELVLHELGLNYRVRVSLRDPDSDKYVGSEDNWDKAEAACIAGAKALGVPYSLEPGEAAFYGPKVDFVAKDALDREWQLGTVQVDYNLPERFDLSYVGADNEKHRPVMIHCAPFGSLERFVGVLIEHFAGDFPLWLCPEQARILPVSEKFVDYAEEVCAAILDAGDFRVEVDHASERVQAKIKMATEMKVPYMLIVGGRDKEAGTVSIRHRTEGDIGSVPVDRFVELLTKELETRGTESILDALRETATA